MSEITVLMSVYNGLPYVREAVESVRAQTLTDWRLLLINDGSSDGSGEYLDGIPDPRVQVVHQENMGLAAALNVGLSLCETPLLARLDADDVADPRRLEVQHEYLKRHPRIGLLGSQFEYLGECRRGRPSTLPLDHDAIVGNLIAGRHALCHASIMCRTELLRQVGGYWERGIGEDWDMYLRMGAATRLANLDESLLRVRVLESSINGSQAGQLRMRIAYACDRWQRERNGLSAIDYDQFIAECRTRSGWQRTLDAMDAYAMAQYRRGLGESLGRKPMLGYLRLAWAAGCSPRLTAQRLARIANRWFRRPVAEAEDTAARETAPSQTPIDESAERADRGAAGTVGPEHRITGSLEAAGRRQAP